MTLNGSETWLFLILWTILPSVVPQFPMPMFPMHPPGPPMFPMHPPGPPMFPMLAPGPPMLPMPQPAPMPVPLPVYSIKFKFETSTTTTTTSPTEDDHIAMAVPIPMPMPLQIAVPAQQPPGFCYNNPRSNNCPPCPPCACRPSCTPSFFSYCSPCHQKCRCRSKEDNPQPLPLQAPQMVPGPAFGMPFPAPPSVLVVPVPSQVYKSKKGRKKYYDDDTDSTDTESCDSSERKRKRGRRKKYRISRRFRRNFDNELVKPVLSYISKDGDVKLKRRINADEAARLLSEEEGHNDKDVYRTIQVVAGTDSNNKQQVVVMSNSNDGELPSNHRYRQVVLRQGSEQHVLGDGRKELVFRPPADKTISNLSVTFQIV